MEVTADDVTKMREMLNDPRVIPNIVKRGVEDEKFYQWKDGNTMVRKSINSEEYWFESSGIAKEVENSEIKREIKDDISRHNAAGKIHEESRTEPPPETSTDPPEENATWSFSLERGLNSLKDLLGKAIADLEKPDGRTAGVRDFLNRPLA